MESEADDAVVGTACHSDDRDVWFVCFWPEDAEGKCYCLVLEGLEEFMAVLDALGNRFGIRLRASCLRAVVIILIKVAAIFLVLLILRLVLLPISYTVILPLVYQRENL